MKQFGTFLSNLRSSIGLSLDELAKLIRTSRSTLSRLENDEISQPFKGSMRQLVISLAELLCSSPKETERYLEMAGIARSLLTETEEIRLGFFPQIAVGSPGEIPHLELLQHVCEQRIHQLQTQTTNGSLPHLKLKIQEYTNILRDTQKRLAVIRDEQLLLERKKEAAAIQTNPVMHYIAAFSQTKRQDNISQRIVMPSETIVETIGGSQELQELAQRPLLLVMMLDVFSNLQEVGEESCSIAKLYQKYIEKWLKQECSTSEPEIHWHEKVEIIQELAWLLYTANSPLTKPYKDYQHFTFTRHNLNRFLEQIGTRISTYPLIPTDRYYTTPYVFDYE